MPIDPATLSSIAADYAEGMTSIRGRRVQRLLKREFAGAACVLRLQGDAGTVAVLGLSTSGAAFCVTDGRGREASVVKWRHGAADALDMRFDLLKDSLPMLGADPVLLASMSRSSRWRVVEGSVPPRASAWALLALKALA